MSRKELKNKFAMTVFVSRWLKKAILAAGFEWRPYIFRAYFATALDTAESKGLISHPWNSVPIATLEVKRYFHAIFSIYHVQNLEVQIQGQKVQEHVGEEHVVIPQV